LSAFFWWFFEYLNRFVQNWYYLKADMDAVEYFIYATLPFSTVLPAVLSTLELVKDSRIVKVFSSVGSIGRLRSRYLPILILVLSTLGLGCIGIWPDYLFPLLWISPLLIVVSIQAMFNHRHLFSSVFEGRWDQLVAPALAGLMCGFFWEMWNYFSYAKWKYNIPFVHVYEIFEMPVLGYAGYIPFGLECIAILELFFGREKIEGIIGCNFH
jgi:hypothetical protein